MRNKLIKMTLATTLWLALTLTIAGCSIIKANSVKTVPLTPGALQGAPMLADLEVDSKKVTGQVKGKAAFKEGLEKEAVAEALKQGNHDVLVGPNFFYEYSGWSTLTVTVVGYPANYKNFRKKEVPEAKEDSLYFLDNNNFLYIRNSKLATTSQSTTTSQPTANAQPIVAVPVVEKAVENLTGE